MRRILAASLMLASMITPAVAKASQPSDDVTALTPTSRISSGVIAPLILNPVSIALPPGMPASLMPVGGQVTLSLTVDDKGQPHNIQVVKSLSPLWDSSVVEAVRQARFRPATLDNLPTSMGMNLVVTIGQ